MTPPPMYRHQIEALQASDGRTGFAYLMEMGTGKTRVAIEDACRAYRRGAIDRVLVFAPKGAYANWVKKELPGHMPEDILWDAYLWTGLGTVKSKNELKEFWGGQPCMRWLVVNIEAMSTSDKAYALCSKFLEAGRTFGIVDESTKIKHKSERTKTLLKLRDKMVMRRIMTGSPVTNSPLHAYYQFEFLQPRCLGYGSFYSFRGTYAILQPREFGGRRIDVVTGYQNTELLEQRLKDHGIRILKKDCLDLPEKIYANPRHVELTGEQERLYRDIKKKATAELENGNFVTATVAITQLLRLHQIVCGHVVDESGGIHSVANNRVDALLDVVEEASGQIIVWAAYRHDIKIISDALRKTGEGVEVYQGGASAAERTQAIENFQSGRSRFFVGTPASGGLGITLTNAETVVYYSNNYDLELREQSEDRAHRIGLKHPVTYVDLVSPGTVDEKILHALRQKINLASSIMGDGWKSWVI